MEGSTSLGLLLDRGFDVSVARDFSTLSTDLFGGIGLFVDATDDPILGPILSSFALADQLSEASESLVIGSVLGPVGDLIFPAADDVVSGIAGDVTEILEDPAAETIAPFVGEMMYGVDGGITENILENVLTTTDYGMDTALSLVTETFTEW